MDFSVHGIMQGLDDTGKGGGKGSRASRSYGDEGMEEVKLDGDEYDTAEEKTRDKPRRKKKKGVKKSGKIKKKRTTDEEDDVDELELGGI